ncbi:MAG TPA: FtsW/RodA/SpoVE family cell cycle protein, partial [Humibacillus xanthopallidus]|nr:FtsW/RodA/SpoVE family cell cycle protein [Humibacillus xanthopallidus]
MTTTVEQLTPRTRRNSELGLLVLAIGIVLLAWVTTDLNRNGTVPANIIPIAGGFTVLVLSVHLVLRWKAAYADPVLLPIATVLNGLGLVMIHRLDLARGKLGTDGDAYRQIIWTTLGVALAIAVIVVLRDHRLLRRYTYVSMAVGFVLLLLPLVPGLGETINGSQIWISVGPFSFQPGEFAKIALAIFFAGYLVQTRDVLSLAGKRVLGFTFPRGRDLGPILVAWLLAVLILVFQKDLGTALLFFGLFVAMLYVATERVSWIAIGLLLFGVAVFFALSAFTHFQKRVDLWLDPFSPQNLERSNQLANGLWGMASGGLTGTGLGAGRPWLTSFAESDFIFSSLGEELGLFGSVAILVLYLIFCERGIRTALGVRDGFGKLLAIGLTFSV